MKEAYESMQGRKKNQIHIRREFVRQLAIKVKYRNKSRICRSFGINRKFLTRSCKEVKPKKRKDAVNEDTQKSIEDFFRQEDISINVPNKKMVKKDNESKFILQGSYLDCYEKWKINQPNSKLSFSKFVKLKPKNVLTQKKRHLLNCLCEYCEGVRLKIETINKLSTQMNNPDLKLGDMHACVEMMLCPKNGDEYKLDCIDRACNTCSTQNLEQKLQPLLALEQVTWHSWDLVKYTNTKTGKESSKGELVEKSDTPDKFIELFLAELTFLIRHLFEARWQQVQFGNLSKSLKGKQIMVTADFAENFTCFSQNEIQGAHWMRNAVTIHPTIVNYTCPDCPDNQIVEECVDIITDDLVHDANAFHHFFQVIHQHLTTTQRIEVEEYVIVSDGCAGQYKCKTAFMDASNSVQEFGVVIERAYYGSRHGKNRCDGEGGILKSKVTRAIRNGEAVINNAEKFAEYCSETLSKGNESNGNSNHKRRKIIYIRKEDINHRRLVQEVKTLKGTRKLHSVRTVRSGVVQTRRLSCFCHSCQHFDYDQCQNSAYVDRWTETSLLHVPRARQNRLQQNDRQQDTLPIADQEPVPVPDDQPVIDPQPAADQQLLVIDMDDSFKDATAILEMDLSFEDTSLSFNTSIDMSAIDAILRDDEPADDTNVQQEDAEQKYGVGEYVLVKKGAELLPAVVS